MKEDPSFSEKIQSFDKQLSRMVKSGKMSQSYNESGKVYEIPVVVHIIHTGGAIGTQYNKSDAEIQAWVDFTNRVYEGTAPALAGPGQRANIPIRFVLAKRDMNCKPTNGIVRINGSTIPGYTQYGLKYGNSNGVSENQITALSRWDPKSYYNIYLVTSISGVAGYAYYPGSFAYDGAFMGSSVVNTYSTTLAHEMGHAMGLKHTFDGANSGGGECPPTTGDCTLDDDGVCDTERAPSALNDWPCKTGSDINSCTGLGYRGVQYNIMNYGSCRDRFTNGQRDRAIAQMLNFRASQISSKGGKAPDSNNNITIKTACTASSIKNPTTTTNMGPANITFGDINYKSQGYNLDGNLFYIDNATKCYAGDISTELKAGVATPLTISVQTNTQNVRAYIDYNNDGIFDEATETVFSKQINKDTSETISVVPPSRAVTNTPLRMRVIADWMYETISPCYNPVYGQIEDFAVTITSPISPCSSPTSLTNSNITQTGIKVNWAAVSGVQNYTLEYKTTAASTWTAVNTTTNTHTLSGLTASTQYNWRVKANCGTNNSSSYTNGTNFTTLTVCNAPTSLTTSNITQTGIKLNWTAVSGVQNYTLEYKTTAASTWTAVNTTTNTHTLSGLTASTQYNWRVKANCGTNNSSSYTNGTNFTTLTVCNAPTSLTTSNITQTGIKLNWTAVSGVQNYTLEYKTTAASTWTAVNTTTNTHTLSGLTASTQYNWRVKANCGTNNSSSYTNGTNFTTLVASGSACIMNYEANETLATAYPINVNTTYSAGISSATDKDYYKFSTTGLNDISITLQNLPKDYELVLYNSNQGQLKSSMLSGTNNESITINSLAAGTYYVYVYGHNGNFDLNQCYNLRVNTTTVNNAPTGLNVSNIAADKATFQWNTITSAKSYTLEYKKTSTSTWTVFASETNSNSVNLNGLSPSTAYNWRVKINYTNGTSSNYTNGTNFSTTAAPACIYNYEANETLATAYPINVNTTYSAGISSATDKDYYKFSTTGLNDISITLQNLPKDYELVLYNSNQGQLKSSMLSGTNNESITINSLAAGTYYVYVYGHNGNFDLNQCYNLRVNTTTVNNAPTGLNVSNIAADKATFQWNTITSAKSYTLEYKKTSTSTWTVFASETNSNSVNLNGLSPSTAYNWRVKINYTNGTSSNYTNGTNFSTTAAPACIYNYEANETLATAYPINVNTTYSAGISSATDKDYYKFSTTGLNDISITLQNLPKDYELVLYNSNQGQLKSSMLSGTNNESITINSLAAGTYYVYVYGHNGNFDLNQCYNLRVNTTTVNNAPTGLNVSNIAADKATFQWNTITSAKSYTLEYKKTSTSTWTVFASETNSNSVNLNGLSPSTAYNWRVKINYTNGTSSNYTNGTNFSTTAAPACIYNYEANETLATAYPINVNTTYSAGISSATDKDYYKFSTTGLNDISITLQNLPKDYELVLYNSNQGQLKSSMLSGTNNESITINSLAAGTYYVYVYGHNGNFDLNQCYNLRVNTTTVNNAPTGLNVSNIAADKATFQWNTITSAKSYTLEYKKTSTSTWTVFASETNSNSVNLNGLSPSTAYNWRVKINYTNGTSSNYTNGTNFSTTAAPACIYNYEANETLATAYPINVNTTYSAGISSATDKDYYKFSTTGLNDISITLQNLPKDYELVLYNSNQGQLKSSMLSGTNNESITINSLAAGTYYVYVYGHNGNFDLNQCYNLRVNTTQVSAKTLAVPEYDKQNNSLSDKVTLYPNPVEKILHISGINSTDKDEYLPVTIIDRNGRIIQTQKVKAEEIIKINVSDLPPNVYYLNILNKNFKFIKI